LDLGPLKGLILGLLFIIFRNQVARGLTKFYQKFPKWEEGVKILNLNLSVKPVYITMLGAVIIVVSVVALIQLNM
jgi:hypothetical protein